MKSTACGFVPLLNMSGVWISLKKSARNTAGGEILILDYFVLLIYQQIMWVIGLTILLLMHVAFMEMR